MVKQLTLAFLFISSLSIAQEVEKAEVTLKRSLFNSDTTKSGYKVGVNVGNVTNKEVEMELNDYALPHYRYDLKYSDWWFDAKRNLNENAGVKVSINYTSMFIGATATVTDSSQQTAASGIFDATIKWTFINRKKEKNKGSIIYWVDNRHIYYGTVSPQFHFQETGSGTMGATKLRKFPFHTIEFYYHQSVFNNNWDIVIGKIALDDWFNFNALAHPLLHSPDLAFSVGPTVPWSNPGFGIVVGGWLDKQKRFALVAGVNDVAGVDLNNPSFLDMGLDQFKKGKLLKMVEFQFTPGRSKYYANRIGITYWHSDVLTIEDESFYTTPASQGINVQGSWVIDDRITPVITFGVSDGNSLNALTEYHFSIMNAWNFKTHDVLGAGINYSKSTYGGGQQLLTEVYYRWTLSKTTAFTPLIKLVINPALNPNVDVLLYYGIRGRISL